MGPVIEMAALQKHLDYIAVGRREGRLVLGGEAIPTPTSGHFLEPTIFADIPPTGRLAQEEIFGPVLTCIRAGLRSGPGHRQQHRIRPHGRAVLAAQRPTGARPAATFMSGTCTSTGNAPACSLDRALRRVQYEWY